jgi:hypothetical protein
MILLIEGCNVCGKSTLAQQFSDDLDWPVLKFNVPSNNAYLHFIGLLSLFHRDHGSFIIDRCHLSNRAYNGQLGGGVMALDEWLKVDDWLRARQTWLFLLVDDPFAIEARLQERTGREDGANQLGRHELAQIQQRFIEASAMSRIEVKGHFTLPQLIEPETGIPTNQYYQIYEQILREKNEES